MRKSSVLLITIAVCLMSASPSQAQRITHSTKIWAQSSAPAKAEKVKCSKYHSPFVRIPKFKLVEQTCEELYNGQSSLKFKAVKIYIYSGRILSVEDYRNGEFAVDPGIRVTALKQVTALKKTLKNLLAKGWDISFISDTVAYDGISVGWEAQLEFFNRKTRVAVLADLRVSVESKLNSTYTKGTWWVEISVSNLRQEAWNEHFQ
jgi:hypothetical protein